VVCHPDDRVERDARDDDQPAERENRSHGTTNIPRIASFKRGADR
jgi:hypothetical protein